MNWKVGHSTPKTLVEMKVETILAEILEEISENKSGSSEAPLTVWSHAKEEVHHIRVR